MKILYLTHSYLPQTTNGLVISTDSELKFFSQQRNIDAKIITTLTKDRRSALYWKAYLHQLLLGKPLEDASGGYSVVRAMNGVSAFAETYDAFRPDIVIVHPTAFRENSAAFLEYLSKLDVPVVIYFLALQSFWTKPGLFTPQSCQSIHVLTNSDYMATELQKRLGLSEKPAYFPPPVEADDVRTQTSRQKVVFVNPVYEKGVERVVALAKARPDLSFEFFGAWGSGRFDITETMAQAHALPNITFREPVKDKRKIYENARIVVAPTVKEEGAFIEAWGRIATEAHVSGIPVLATSGSGLDQSVGPGGILVDQSAPMDVWLEALSTLMDNDEAYQQYSQAALQYAQRPEIQVQSIMDSFFEELQKIAGKRAP